MQLDEVVGPKHEPPPGCNRHHRPCPSRRYECLIPSESPTPADMPRSSGNLASHRGERSALGWRAFGPAQADVSPRSAWVGSCTFNPMRTSTLDTPHTVRQTVCRYRPPKPLLTASCLRGPCAFSRGCHDGMLVIDQRCSEPCVVLAITVHSPPRGRPPDDILQGRFGQEAAQRGTLGPFAGR